MERIRLFVNGVEVNADEPEERQATGVACWYDPHFRHWVLYPVDAEGNQLQEACYAFGKKEAKIMKADMEEAITGQRIYSEYAQFKGRLENG